MTRTAACVVCAVVLGVTAAPAGAQEVAVHKSHGLAMHGDLLYPADFEHLAYVNPDAPKGGALRLGARGSFDTFNQFTLKGTAALNLGLLYDTLMTGSADEPFSEYGLLVETVEMPEDRTWVTFHLREEARWHDGKPVTADDVVFTFDILTTKGHPFYRFYYKSIDRVEKRGDRTVTFHFTKGEVNREMPLIAGQFVVLPRHYWKDRDFESTTLDLPVGSGPYRIKAFEANRYVIYERVKDYWGKDLPIRKGMFNFDEVKCEYFRDETVLREAFRAGAYDVHFENNSKEWATAYGIPAVENGLIRKENVPHGHTSGMQCFAMNTRRELFQDARVRQALAGAFDFEWSNKKLFYGAYTRCRSYFNNSELEAKGPPEGEELALLKALDKEFPGRVPPEALTAAYEPPSTGEWEDEREHRRALRANLRRSMNLLKAAGWSVRKTDKKLVHPDYKDDRGNARPFRFEVLLVSPAFERIVLAYVQNLEQLGVDARVQTVDTVRYQKRVEEFDYDMIVGSFGQSLSPGNEQRNMWGSAAADTRGSRNLVGIKDPAIDKAVDWVIQAPDRKGLIVRTRVLDRLLQWGHYTVPQWYLSSTRVAYWDKFATPETPPRLGDVQIYTWWVDPAKEKALADKRGN